MPKAKPGTQPKQTGIEIPHRFPSGELRPAADAVKPMAPTLIKRLKDNVLPTLNDKRLGTVLGLMHLEGILSEAEVEAGFRYAEDVGAFERMNGSPARHARSVSFDGGFRGAADLDLDMLRRMDPEAAKKVEAKIKRRQKVVKKRYDRVQACIPIFPIIVSTVVEAVCCNDERVSPVHHAGLKQILRNLANHYGIAVSTDAANRPRTSKKADASLLAQGAIDAMARWFEGRIGTVTTYRVQIPARHATPALTAYGYDYAGNELAHTIHLPRSGMMIEEINAQLIKLAEDDKNWKPAGTAKTAKAPTIEEVRKAFGKDVA